MTIEFHSPPLGPTSALAERLLAGVAIRIELPPSLHQLAVERYEAVRKHIERIGSPLHDKVAWFYPQGSMAIKATIKSRRREDGYDIDIVCELLLPHSLAPAQVLDLLYASIRGEHGSMYREMAERQTRCVTVYYGDGMHLDVTPSILLDEYDPRRSHIFHAKPEEPVSAHKRIVTNSYGFCEHFNSVLPPDLLFAQAYAERSKKADWRSIRADADVKPVPAHSTIEGGKSAAVVALQLLKRNRNMGYAKRNGARLPPSVMMAAFTCVSGAPVGTISGALDKISASMLSALEDAAARNTLVDVRNPKCRDDCFTDRWPENFAAQKTYIADLRKFRQQLNVLVSGNLDLEEMQILLVEMFGESPVRAAIEEQAEILGQAIKTGNRNIGISGRVVPTVAAPAIFTATAVAAPRNHTFYGERWKK